MLNILKKGGDHQKINYYSIEWWWSMVIVNKVSKDGEFEPEFAYISQIRMISYQLMS